MIEPAIRAISLGAGRQSTAQLFMSAEGRFGPVPDVAIFADTQWEPDEVYEHVEWLKSVSPIPIAHVTAGDLKAHTLNAGKVVDGKKMYNRIPFYTKSARGKKGKLRRQCTQEFKIVPVRRHLSKMLVERGLKKTPGVVELHIGISLDEFHRAKPSSVKYVVNRHPLVEHGVTVEECVRYLNSRGFHTPPKSACIGCPFHRDHRWAEMKEKHPDQFQQAVEFDRSIRRMPMIDDEAFVHDSRQPLELVDFGRSKDQLELEFVEECEGMCGV